MSTGKSWGDLTQSEKEAMLPWIEMAKEANSLGNPEAEQSAKRVIATLAESYGLDPKKWSVEALNRKGCLLLAVCFGSLAIGGLGAVFARYVSL